jgi:hypothetical protein
MRVDAKSEVAQHLGTEPVAQTHVLESDHVLLRLERHPPAATPSPGFIAAQLPVHPAPGNLLPGFTAFFLPAMAKAGVNAPLGAARWFPFR